MCFSPEVFAVALSKNLALSVRSGHASKSTTLIDLTYFPRCLVNVLAFFSLLNYPLRDLESNVCRKLSQV